MKRGEWRCNACRTLLAKFNACGITILRGGLQVAIDGNARVSVVCYQKHCRTLNVAQLRSEAVVESTSTVA